MSESLRLPHQTDVIAFERLETDSSTLRASAATRRTSGEEFEELLATWTARLLAASGKGLDDAIDDALGAFAVALGHRWAALVRIDASSNALRVLHQWPEPSRSDSRGRDSLLGRAATASTDEIVAALLSGRTVVITRNEAPPDLVRMLDACDCPGLLAIPVNADGAMRCCALVDVNRDSLSQNAQRRWRIAAAVLATTTARRLAERAERSAFEATARLDTLGFGHGSAKQDLVDNVGEEIIGTSAAMGRVLELVKAVAATSAAVLIRGESGVGKELVARAIHAASDRRNRPLVKVNCASIPRELFESEFFGHVKGAFTGAVRERIGRFELANGGTLFLDEIGEIPLSEQAKLLRVLQEGELERVGDDRTRRVDVRIIAATNRKLERDVVEGKFRRDLYFRLNVFPIDVPPLRQRREDVIPLASHFLKVHALRLGRRGLELSPADRALLLGYDWPGNVRELMHVIERAVILSPAPPLRLSIPDGALQALPLSSDPDPRAAHARALRTFEDLRRAEIEMIQHALAVCGGRIAGKSGAAERLGLSPSTLRDRMKALGIKRR